MMRDAFCVLRQAGRSQVTGVYPSLPGWKLTNGGREVQEIVGQAGRNAAVSY
jgi:hypothetical protein